MHGKNKSNFTMGSVRMGSKMAATTQEWDHKIMSSVQVKGKKVQFSKRKKKEKLGISR